MRAALSQARDARRLFRRQGRDWWEARADLVALQARLLRGDRGAELSPAGGGRWPTGSSSSELTRHPALVLAGRLDGTGRRPSARPRARPLRRGGPVPAAHLGAGARHRLARPGARPRDRRRLPWRLLRLRSRARCAGRAPRNLGQLRAAGTAPRVTARTLRRSSYVRRSARAGRDDCSRGASGGGPRHLPSPRSVRPRTAPGPDGSVRSAHMLSGSRRHASRTTRRPPSGSVGPGNARSGTSGTCSPGTGDRHARRSWTLRDSWRSWGTPRLLELVEVDGALQRLTVALWPGARQAGQSAVPAEGRRWRRWRRSLFVLRQTARGRPTGKAGMAEGLQAALLQAALLGATPPGDGPVIVAPPSRLQRCRGG